MAEHGSMDGSTRRYTGIMDMIKLSTILREVRLKESGIRDINKLAKEFKEAVIYFHMDLDGVTTAIGMKEYLAKYGIKTTETYHIQYGEREYGAPKPPEGKMVVIVDFAHGKPMAHIHIDHHDRQSGVEKGTSTSFVRSPSNVETISQQISPQDLFPASDLKVISMVDSAGFLKQGISVDDVIKSVFKFDKSLGGDRNHTLMGLVVNKLLLAFKSKPGFLEALVLKAKPSLISLYNVIMDEVRQRGFSLDDYAKAAKKYGESQAPDKKMKELKNVSEIQNLRDGEYALFGNCLVQYGGGRMTGGGYDRYTPFKNVPQANYLVIGWANGLVQASKNPFKQGSNPVDLGGIGREIIEARKPELESLEITLRTLKRSKESDIRHKGATNAFGFSIEDLKALFDKAIKGLPDWEANPYKREMLDGIANRPYTQLSDEEKAILEDVTITAYDIVDKSSGGHRNITNISGLNFYGEGYTAKVKEIMGEFADKLKDIKFK
jgi:hypothetical protein